MALTLVWIAAYLRIFMGADLTDEAQYVASAYLPLIGGKPFFNEMFLQQSASLIYTPLLAVYWKLTGSIDGVILYVRHLYAALALFTAWNFFRYFKSKADLQTTLWTATVFLTFIPWCLPSLSYNTLGYFGFANFLLFQLQGLENPGRRNLAAGSCSAALTAASYPTLAVAMGVYFLTALPWFWKARKKRLFLFQSALTSAALAILCASAFLLFDWQDLQDSYHFSRTFGAGGGLEKLIFAFQLAGQIIPPWPWLSGLFILAVWIQWQTKFSQSLIFWLASMAYFAFSRRTDEASSSINQVHIFLWFLFCLSFGLSWRRELRTKLLPFSLSCLTGVLVLMYSSSMTVFAAVYCSVIFLVVIWPMLPGSDLGRRVFMIALNITLLTGSYLYNYRDYSLSMMQNFVSEGPYAGILTSEPRVLLISEVQSDLQEFKSRASTVLFYDSFPAGYLMSELKPATRSLFMHPLPLSRGVRNFYADYYSRSENLPDLVFDFKTIPFSEMEVAVLNIPGFDPYRDPMKNFFLKTGRYQLARSRTHYDIYLKVPPSDF